MVSNDRSAGYMDIFIPSTKSRIAHEETHYACIRSLRLQYTASLPPA
jgi:hypothetical protein